MVAQKLQPRLHRHLGSEDYGFRLRADSEGAEEVEGPSAPSGKPVTAAMAAEDLFRCIAAAHYLLGLPGDISTLYRCKCRGSNCCGAVATQAGCDCGCCQCKKLTRQHGCMEGDTCQKRFGHPDCSSDMPGSVDRQSRTASASWHARSRRCCSRKEVFQQR